MSGGSGHGGWMAGLEDRAGPLLAAAVRYLDGNAAGFPRGADALREIAQRLDAQVTREDASPEDDRRFAEGAGALLGLVLIDQLDGCYRGQGELHRVALGPYGFFDPFATMEAALDAADPRRELARRVGVAEAEAAGSGPVSRVVGAFARALAAGRPDLAIERQFELELTLGDGIEVDLRQVAEATDSQALAAVERQTERIVSLLGAPDGAAAVPWREARERLLPRLVGGHFRDEISAGRSDGPPLELAPFCGDLLIALILRYPDRARYVRTDELASWGMDPDLARVQAIRNLASRSDAARFARVDTDRGPIVVARSGDGLDAARLLLPGLPGVLGAELDPPILVAVPHRDALLACSGLDPDVVDSLRERARRDAARAPQRISAQLFELTADGVMEHRRSNPS